MTNDRLAGTRRDAASTLGSETPVDGRAVAGGEEVVGLGEVSVGGEFLFGRETVLREGRRVLVGEDHVARGVDVRAGGGFGFAAPKHEDDEGRLGLDGAEDRLGERLPAEFGVAHGFAGTDGEYRVEEQDALMGPRFEVSVGGRAPVGETAGEGGVDGFERRGEFDGRRNGEGEPVGVAGRGVGVLSEDDDLHIGGSDEGERAEEIFAGGKDVGGRVGFGDGGGEGGKLLAGVTVVEEG
jgi:hypothetical protein